MSLAALAALSLVAMVIHSLVPLSCAFSIENNAINKRKRNKIKLRKQTN